MPIQILGGLLVLSTPVTGFVSYAALAIALGEDRLETADGLTVLGWLAILVPAVAGAAMIAVGFVRPVALTRRALMITTATVASGAVGLGAWSVRSSAADGDASIGGSLLVMVGLVLGLVVLAGAVTRLLRRPARHG